MEQGALEGMKSGTCSTKYGDTMGRDNQTMHPHDEDALQPPGTSTSLPVRVED